LFFAGSARVVKADGIIIPEPCVPERCPPPPPCSPEFCPPPRRPIAQLIVKYHRVEVRINDQLAVTRVDQVFSNPNKWAIEGTYMFPLPVGAVASGLKLWVDGEPVEGKLLGAGEARRIYEETVRSLRDPALLEYSGRGALQLSLFPIPPNGERRIQLEYSQALQAENGLVRYTYPLSTEKFSAQPLEEVSVRVELSDRAGLRVVYSPTHPVDVTREGTRNERALVGYEARNVLPESDFTLYYSTGSETGLNLLTFRDPGDLDDPEGYFLLLLAPGAGAESPAVPKDVMLVLDRSGSMEGEKFRQAQEALRFILQRLNTEDRFYLQAFSTGVQAYAAGLRSADEVPEALAWVDRLGASGSTDINRALLETAAAASEARDPLRPLYLIFLTDGLPTIGEIQTQAILDNFLRAAPDNLRLFAFGVGYDVDTILLDTLSGDHNGTSTYVRPQEALGEKLSAFYETISRPVLTGLDLDFGGLAVYDLYPNPLPDLFAGSQMLLAGRYRAGGAFDLTVRGQVGAEPVELVFPKQMFAQDSRTGDPELGAVARIWASRKIGMLLNQVRLKGPDEETIAQIVRLSVRFGIVTPYTSYLVEEPMPLGADAQSKMAEEAYSQAQSAPADASGEGAVNRAAKEGELQAAGAAPLNSPAESGGNVVRTVGGRTFVYNQGFWTDTAFDPQTKAPVDIQFLSAEYFALAQSRPDLAAVLALGERVILIADGVVYRVTNGNADPMQQETLVPTATQVQQNQVPSTTPGSERNDPAATSTPQPVGGETNPGGGCPPALMLVGIALAVSLLVKKR
jgi:Ca-activated chloride channel family protein